MLKVTKSKLTKLANFLEKKVPSRRFKLDKFSDKGFPDGECGTAACACGWGTVCFPRSGLKLVPRDSDFVEECTLTYKDKHGRDAAQEFFKLGPSDIEYLFWGSEYPENRRGKKSVIKRIRKFVKDGGVK